MITGIDSKILYNNIVFKNNNIKVKNKENKREVTDIIIEVKGTLINIKMNKDYYNGVIEKNNFYHNRILGDLYDEAE